MRLKKALLLILISFIFTYPFFLKGYFKTHDGEWAIVRIAEMGREIRDIQIPPRWSDFLNHGYGYPLFLFTYPFPYYLGELLHFLGLGFTESLKTLFVISVIISAFGMYFYSRRYWGKFGAIISSIFYIVVPYRLVDLYIRGSLGETIVMAIIPWLFWSIDKFFSKEHRNDILVSLLFACLILSHNASAFLFSLLLFFYLIKFLIFEKENIFRLLTPFIKGLMVSSFFWLPALFEKKYIYLGNFPLADKNLHFVTLYELLVHNKGSGIKPPLFIGYAHLIVLIISLIVFLTINNTRIKKLLLFNLLGIFISVFLLNSASLPIWRLPGFSSIDFPWRVLLVIAFLSSFISGSLILLPKGKCVGIVISILTLFIYFPLVRVEERFIKDDNYYETNDATTTSNDELMPIWVYNKPKSRPSKKVVIESGTINDLFYNSKYIEFVADLTDDQLVTINTIYFPGWQFWIDGKGQVIKESGDKGLIVLNVPGGRHQIKGKFLRTPIRVLADTISGIGFGIIILSLMKKTLSKLKFKR